MTALFLVLSTALLLGALHAFDADHLAAVTVFIARRPAPLAALSFALRWGMGHAATLLAVGSAAAFLRLTITPDLEAAAEMAVGLMLVAVGAWALHGISRGRLLIEQHLHGEHGEHRHTHLHRPDHSLTSRHSIFWVGALHGLAGSAGLLVIIPVGMMSSVGTVIAWIVTFNVGVSIAMGLYAMAIGGIFTRLSGNPSTGGGGWYMWLAGAAGTATVLLGLFWIGQTVVGLAGRGA